MVTDIKALMYEPNKTISYKLRFTEQNWSAIPLMRNSKQEKVTFDMLPKLHMNRIKIKKEKYQHLQELKSSMKIDYHSFFDNLPHE